VVNPSPVVPTKFYQQQYETESSKPKKNSSRKGKERAGDTYTELTEEQEEEILKQETMLNYYRDLLKYNKASEEDFLFSQETSFPQESSPSQEVRLLLEETDLSQEEIMLLLEQQANLPLQESSIPQVLNPPQQEEANVLVEEADSQQQQEVIVTTLETNLPQEEATIPQEEKSPFSEKEEKKQPFTRRKKRLITRKSGHYYFRNSCHLTRSPSPRRDSCI
jgi:hypothetical protein